MKKKLICGECGHRLLFHYEYSDVNKNSRYSRCDLNPRFKQKNNSCPKWCPLKNTK